MKSLIIYINENNYEKLFEEINKLNFIKKSNLVINKIKIDGKKNSDARSIDVYFKKQEYPVRVMIDKNETSKKGIIIPAFFIWVDKNDDNYEIRKNLCIWLYKRFWIYLHKIDKRYDEYVNGNFENSYSDETDKWTYKEFYSYVKDI